MFEPEKLLYEKAGVTAKECCERDSDLCMSCCPKWNERQSCWKYMRLEPLFTFDRQIKIIEFLLSSENFNIEKIKGKYKLSFRHLTTENIPHQDFRGRLEFCLLEVLNYFWEYFTDEEKEEIKEILE